MSHSNLLLALCVLLNNVPISWLVVIPWSMQSWVPLAEQNGGGVGGTLWAIGVVEVKLTDCFGTHGPSSGVVTRLVVTVLRLVVSAGTWAGSYHWQQSRGDGLWFIPPGEGYMWWCGLLGYPPRWEVTQRSVCRDTEERPGEWCVWGRSGQVCVKYVGT